MTAKVALRIGDGAPVWVAEGGLLGRSPGAALRLSAPDVSEVHAMVSRREVGLVLLALRGGVSCGGRSVREVVLTPGVVLALGVATRLEVVEVVDVAPGAPIPSTLGGAAPVTLDIRPGHVVLRQGAAEVVLVGNLADLVGQLVDAAAPVHWTTLCHYFWSERDQERWRARFDATVKELRGKLRDARIRDDLLQSGQGTWWLALRDGDVVHRSAL